MHQRSGVSYDHSTNMLILLVRCIRLAEGLGGCDPHGADVGEYVGEDREWTLRQPPRASCCYLMRFVSSICTHIRTAFAAQTCIARAWSTKKPFFYAPAMNTDMWDHPVTAKHLKALTEFGYQMIPPVEKMLACGVVGTCTQATERMSACFLLGLFEAFIF